MNCFDFPYSVCACRFQKRLFCLDTEEVKAAKEKFNQGFKDAEAGIVGAQENQADHFICLFLFDFSFIQENSINCAFLMIELLIKKYDFKRCSNFF